MFCSFAMLACLVQTAPAVDAYAAGSSLVVNEVVVARIRAAAGNLEPSERAASAATVVRTYEQGASVKVLAGPEPRIMLGKRAVITITAKEAAAHGSQPEKLADDWAKAINNALALPPLVVGRSPIIVPIDGATELKVVGSLARKSVVQADPSHLLLIRRAVGVVQMTGTEQGRGSLVVSTGFGETRLAVMVAPYAADFPQRISALVTGQPASPQNAAAAVQAAVMANLRCAPGAQIRCSPVEGAALEPGVTKPFAVDVTVSAPGCVDSKGVVTVAVTNRGGGRSFEDLLWYSNEPENLRWSGQVYWGRFNTGSPVRLLWHHYNKSQSPLYLQYVLANRGDVPAQVLVVAGDAEPDLDPTKAGYMAGIDYWKAWLDYSGTVLTVPPKSVVPLVLRRMAPGVTVSGLATMRLIDGSDDVVLVGNALTPADLPGPWRGAYTGPAPWGVAQPLSTSQFAFPLVGTEKHVYRQPAKSIEFEYAAGGPFAFVRIGQNGIPSVDQQTTLAGNFGVHYTVEGLLTNPTDKPARTIVEFEASAGYAGAIFLVNGQLVNAKILPTKGTIVLMDRVVQPGDQQFVRIETMPLSGASYPATITVRPPH